MEERGEKGPLAREERGMPAPKGRTPARKEGKTFWDRLSAWIPDIFSPERFDSVRIEPEVVADICALARSAHPNETVAFLTGAVHGEGEARVLVIDGLYLKGYDADEYTTWFTTHDLPLTGVYGTVHSHPGWSNRPSEADKQLFSHHGWFHLIVCQPYTRGSIAAYGKGGERIEVGF